jgi:hypothetical protein
MFIKHGGVALRYIRATPRYPYLGRLGWHEFIHTGCASASTAARNLMGRPTGVNTSTDTPSKSSSSIRSPLKSKNVVPGSASTNKSRSLPSLSDLCKTDPKIRGFAARNRATVALTAARWGPRARLGFIRGTNSINAVATRFSIKQRSACYKRTPID